MRRDKICAINFEYQNVPSKQQQSTSEKQQSKRMKKSSKPAKKMVSQSHYMFNAPLGVITTIYPTGNNPFKSWIKLISRAMMDAFGCLYKETAEGFMCPVCSCLKGNSN